MKKTILIILLTIVCLKSYAQPTVQINYDPGRGVGSISTNVTGSNQTLNVANTVATLNTFNFSSSISLATGQKLVVTCNGIVLNTTVTTNGDYLSGTKTFTYEADIIGHLIEVKLDPGGGAALLLQVSFTFVKDAPNDQANTETPNRTGNGTPSIAPFIKTISDRYKRTKIGLIESQFAKQEDLEEENAIHIFFDQNGNNILGTIPQGIANRQYIVHILYPGYIDVEDDLVYSVRQKTGSFNGSLNFLNSGIQNQLGNHFQAAIVKKPYDTWVEKIFLLGTATDDLTFEIIATTIDPTTKRAVSGVLETYVIKMSPVYHGSFDIGLINSELINPTFSLTNSPINPTEKLVKETNGGNRGIVTIMATFYTSPIILLEKLLEKRTNKHIPSYKLTGRNLLDDHKFYERFYPAVGVSLSNRTFENLFFGLNWELARGLSVFGGGHWGKVNTFNMPDYENNVTAVTQEQFDYYTNQKWKLAWAYGIKLDVLIIANLFK